MKAKEIAFVCYGVKDINRARKFYENVLGLKPGMKWIDKKSGMGFVEYYMGSHTLAIGQGAKNFKPGKNGATVALEVEDFGKAMKKLNGKKVKFLMPHQDTKVCHMILIADTEGNQIMIHQRKKQPKKPAKKKKR